MSALSERRKMERTSERRPDKQTMPLLGTDEVVPLIYDNGCVLSAADVAFAPPSTGAHFIIVITINL